MAWIGAAPTDCQSTAEGIINDFPGDHTGSRVFIDKLVYRVYYASRPRLLRVFPRMSGRL